MESITRRELETIALRKFDQNAAEIIDSAPLAAAYLFDKDQLKWEKLNCEGILFLYKKLYEPHYNLFLLNRQSNLHLYQPVSRNLKLQVEDSYLLFRNDDSTIFGLWIYDKQIFARISDEMKKVIYNIHLKTFCKVPLVKEKDEDISKMLRKTEEEYLKSFYCLKRLQIEKENEPVTTPKSVAKFFEDAGKVFKNTKPNVKRPFFRKSCSDNSVFMNFIRNSEYDVESIEKNQRCSYLMDN